MRKPSEGVYCRVIKRGLDIVLALFSLLLLGIPMLFVAGMVRIKLGKAE